jgi:UDP-glucuronate 4-epimerase
LRALVTGVAGFIGSHLAEALRARDDGVVGVDCLTDYYDASLKRRNLDEVRSTGATIVEEDLRSCELAPLLDGTDVVFHLAGQPGVRASWSTGFGTYDQHNIAVTQRLLEAVRENPVKRFVFASSSSVYGNAVHYPTTEDDLPRPNSPYGVTKLAAEHLCSLYADNFDVHTVALRYFTVYGPRQRPDMAIHRLVEAALGGPPFPLFGDGSQIRDFTYVSDIVSANLRAADHPRIEPGTVTNVAGGDRASLAEVVTLVSELTGRQVPLDRQSAQPGDVRQTGGSTDRLFALLDWRPSTPLREGLTRQIDWHRSRRSH